MSQETKQQELVVVDEDRQEYARQFQGAAEKRAHWTDGIRIEIRAKPPEDMDAVMDKLRKRIEKMTEVERRRLWEGEFEPAPRITRTETPMVPIPVRYMLPYPYTPRAWPDGVTVSFCASASCLPSRVRM
jgi:hypothetical protein